MKYESQIYISKLEERTKVRFLDKTLLSHALGPTSKEKKRLELLGDAFLATAVIEYIQKFIPDISNDECTRLKQSYVNNKRLIQVGIELGLHEFSEWEGRKTLANTVEALIGAIYRDRGYDIAKLFIFNCLLPQEKELGKKLGEIKKRYQNLEIVLREKVEKQYNKLPYMIIEQGNDKVTICIYAGGECIATGKGKSKKQARINAIDTALKKIEIKAHSINPR